MAWHGMVWYGCDRGCGGCGGGSGGGGVVACAWERVGNMLERVGTCGNVWERVGIMWERVGTRGTVWGMGGGGSILVWYGMVSL